MYENTARYGKQGPLLAIYTIFFGPDESIFSICLNGTFLSYPSPSPVTIAITPCSLPFPFHHLYTSYRRIFLVSFTAGSRHRDTRPLCRTAEYAKRWKQRGIWFDGKRCQSSNPSNLEETEPPRARMRSQSRNFVNGESSSIYIYRQNVVCTSC